MGQDTNLAARHPGKKGEQYNQLHTVLMNLLDAQLWVSQLGRTLRKTPCCTKPFEKNDGLTCKGEGRL